MCKFAGLQIRFSFLSAARAGVVGFLFMLLSITDANAFIDDIWQEYTPGKNIIGNNEDGRGTYLYYKNGELHQLKEWYFYKAHILGSFSTGAAQAYFILNERNKHLMVFHLKKDFESYARKHKLNPVVKRTYGYKWSLFPKESGLNCVTAIVFIFAGGSPVVLFQLMVFGIICVVMWLRGQLKSFLHSVYEVAVPVVKAVWWVSMYAVPVVLLIWYVKGAFPQSI